MLGEIAQIDRRLAYTLLESGRVGQGGRGPGYIDTGGWELYNLVARWESAAANQQIEAKLQGQVETDFWVRSLRYTVRRPNWAPASLFKAQSDYFNTLNPNIDFTLIVKSYCNYAISPDPTPLENMREVFSDSCPVGMVLNCAATFDSFFCNLRALVDNDGSSEIPTEAVVTFSGIRLKQGIYGGCDYDWISKALTKEGYLPPSCG